MTQSSTFHGGQWASVNDPRQVIFVTEPASHLAVERPENYSLGSEGPIKWVPIMQKVTEHAHLSFEPIRPVAINLTSYVQQTVPQQTFQTIQPHYQIVAQPGLTTPLTQISSSVWSAPVQHPSSNSEVNSYVTSTMHYLRRKLKAKIESQQPEEPAHPYMLSITEAPIDLTMSGAPQTDSNSNGEPEAPSFPPSILDKRNQIRVAAVQSTSDCITNSYNSNPGINPTSKERPPTIRVRDVCDTDSESETGDRDDEVEEVVEEWWANGRRIINSQELIKISIKDLNKRLRNLPRVDALRLKHKRRTLKNRRYAQDCRIRRQRSHSSLEKDLESFRERIKELENRLVAVERERDELRGQIESSTVRS